MKKYIFFFGEEKPESNFYLASFVYKGESFNCSEQAYMWEKAMYFKDYSLANTILRLKRPAEQKKAGKLVQDYDKSIWDTVKTQYMYQVCLHKFDLRFNPGLFGYLIGTGDSILVEASPYDLQWGIGLNAYDAAKTPETDWPGKNLLGKVLMHVRDDLTYKLTNDSEYRKLTFTNLL